MTIEEYVDILNTNIEVTYHPNQKRGWTAKIEHAETKKRGGDVGLLFEYGEGHSPDEAVNDYVAKIKNKLLVINAMDEKRRREYRVPETLSGRSKPL